VVQISVVSDGRGACDLSEPVVELNAAGAVQATNVLAPDGLVARQQSGTWTQYTFDQQGNVAQRLNSSQVVTSSSTYDAYGIESSSGTPSDVFGYNARWGYLLDRETGFYICQHRYYDPGTGRWAGRDPMGSNGGINIYQYCFSSPIGQNDPEGLRAMFCQRPVDVGPIQTPGDHWWLQVPGCGSIGYGPGGIHPDRDYNSGGRPVDQIGCRVIQTTPAQNACLCHLKKILMTNQLAEDPLSPEQKAFCRPWSKGTFNPLSHNCQDFVTCLLNHCGLSAPPTMFPDFGNIIGPLGG